MRSAFSMTIRLALGTSTPTSMTVVATSSCVRPALNSCIAFSLARGGMRPWTRPTRTSGSAAASGRRFPRRPAPRSLLGLVDERTHPVRLPARAARGGDALDHLGATLLARAPRCAPACGRAAARRSPRRRGPRSAVIASVRGIGVAVMISWCGTVRRAGPCPQRQALLHAEAVLLVDDGERQAREGHAFLEQRVRAHGDLHLAAARRRPARCGACARAANR